MNSITKMLFVALAVIAAGSLFVMGGKSAHAQAAEGATLTIEKICLLDEEEVVDEEIVFDVALDPDLEIDTEDLELLDLLEEEFDLDFTDLTEDEINEAISAALSSVVEVSCGGETVLEVGGEGEFDPAFTELVELLEEMIIAGDLISGDLIITELLGEGVAGEGCTIQIFPEEGDPSQWEEFLSEAGLTCVITNDLTPDAASLTVTKVCPNGSGDATFNISVDGASTVYACGTVVTVPGLEAGDVTITEVIGGTDAGDFTTSIDCDDGTEEAGTTATVTMAGEPVSCDVVNIFTGDDGLTDDEIAAILAALDFEFELELEIKNILNNINDNTNISENTNVNENQNTNTQNQTNDQTTNVATGDVNVSSGGGEGTGTGTGSGTGAHGHHDKPKIHAPNTGDGGLAGSSNGSGFGAPIALAAVATVLGTLSLAAVKFAGARS